jgi:hypothetical protein
MSTATSDAKLAELRLLQDGEENVTKAEVVLAYIIKSRNKRHGKDNAVFL